MYFVIFLLFGIRYSVFADGMFKFENQLVASNGLAFPHKISVGEGHEVMVKLVRHTTNQENCVVITPQLEEIDVTAFKNERIHKWDFECSVKIKNVTLQDHGRWKLQSKRGQSTLQGLFTVSIQNHTMPAEVNELDIVETDDPALLQFSDQASTYCSLSHMGDVFFVPGCCQLNMDKVAKTVQGQWKLSAGLPWQIEEREVEKDVKVYTSDVTVGWEKVQNKDIINLFCNIKHSEMNVTFCRFSRMNDKGFNLMDGIGNGRYNYYGEGLKNKECGMTITSPQNEDYGRWKCTLGVVDKGNNFTTMDRVLQINKPRTPASGDENVNIRTVLAVNTKPLTVDCDSNGVAITYCWLQHPNGTKFTPVLKEMADVPYWYSYKNLGVGECSMTLKEGSTQDSGKWLCHMGRSHPGGVELTSEVMVRVGGPIAAKESVVSVKRGDTTSIHCVTSGQKQPLKYCRFTEPDGSTVFSIDDDATKDKPILGQYYFMDKASLNFGDCAVTIIRVEAHHFGKWSCAALIQDDFMESSDYIILESNETAMSAASVTGISLGVICVVAGISLLVYQRWKRRSALLELPHRGGQLNPEPPRDSDVTVSFRVSDMSDSSTAQLNINPTSSTSPQYGTSTSIQ